MTNGTRMFKHVKTTSGEARTCSSVVNPILIHFGFFLRHFAKAKVKTTACECAKNRDYVQTLFMLRRAAA